MVAPTTGESKTGKSTIKKSGEVENGKNKKQNSCERIQPVGIVAVNLLFPIIQTTKSTESLNISTLKVQSLSATLVTEGFTKDYSHVLDAQKLGQRWPIRHAINALAKAINNELQNDKILGTNQRTNTKEGSIGNFTQRKS